MSERLHMPSLGGATGWINTEPSGPGELRGRPVLVNFWTLTCINWLRQAPYVRAWSRAYRDDGLLVIGVHTPEFSFEHDVDAVRRAVEERGIYYPVAVDNDYAIWSAFANHYWPALYFVDADGRIRDEHFGEGRYEESERVLQALLGVEGHSVRVEASGVEAPADWADMRTPETYLGFGRDGHFASPQQAVRNERRIYDRPRDLRSNEWALAGSWTVETEKAVVDEPGGTIAVRFQARDANLVLDSGTTAAIPFRVRLDGAPVGSSRGVDVDEDGTGLLADGRLYQLVRTRGEVRERLLEITFAEPGAQAYAFTFG